jgi:hypothetical protein
MERQIARQTPLTPAEKTEIFSASRQAALNSDSRVLTEILERLRGLEGNNPGII